MNTHSLTTEDREKEGWTHMRAACELHENGKYEAAKSEYCASIKYGNVYAHNNLADLLSDEDSGLFDFNKAVYHYKLAVNNGLSGSAFALAITYRMNKRMRGLTYWLKRVAEIGDTDAKDEISKLK